MGSAALQNNISGSNNSAYGNNALYSNKTGYSNVAVGSGALYNNTDGYQMVAIGDSALLNQSVNGKGLYGNTAVGDKASYSNTTGFLNTAIGVYALYFNTIGNDNTALGKEALYESTGNYNTAAGSEAFNVFAAGSNNTGVGYQAFYNRNSGSFLTAIGDAANVNADGLTNATALGAGATATASNQVMLGNASVTSVIAAGSVVIVSDGRFKKNIEANVPGLAFIKQLKPVTYHYDIHGLNDHIGVTKLREKANSLGKDMDQTNREDTKMNELEENAIAAKEKILYTGFVAQDVEAAAKKINYDFSGIYKPQNDKDAYGLSYSDFVVPLVKAVQELSTQNDSLKETVSTQQKANIELQKQNIEIRQQFEQLKSLVLAIQQKQDQCSPCGATGTAVQPYNTTIGSGASLEQNVPNPFTHSTSIGYTLPQQFATAQITITDNDGKTLKTVSVSGSGKGVLNVDAATLVSGAYYYSLIVDGKLVATKQMVLAR
jgi:hypothetical protein